MGRKIILIKSNRFYRLDVYFKTPYNKDSDQPIYNIYFPSLKSAREFGKEMARHFRAKLEEKL